MPIWNQKLTNQIPTTILEILSSYFIDFYPNIEILKYYLQQPLLLSTCTSEISFSSLKLILKKSI